MDQENIELFRRLREKATTLNKAYADKRLEELLALINPEKHRTHYLGYDVVMDRRIQYMLTSWPGEATIGIKTREQNEEPDYLFFHVALDADNRPTEFRGLHCTAIPKTEARFRGKMGSVVMDGSGKEEYLLNGVLKDVLGAREDDSAFN